MSLDSVTRAIRTSAEQHAAAASRDAGAAAADMREIDVVGAARQAAFS